MGFIDNTKLMQEIILCISKYTVHGINEIEYAFNKVLSLDLLLETLDYADRWNLTLGKAAHDVKMFRLNDDDADMNNNIINRILENK